MCSSRYTASRVPCVLSVLLFVTVPSRQAYGRIALASTAGFSFARYAVVVDGPSSMANLSLDELGVWAVVCVKTRNNFV